MYDTYLFTYLLTLKALRYMLPVQALPWQANHTAGRHNERTDGRTNEHAYVGWLKIMNNCLRNENIIALKFVIFLYEICKWNVYINVKFTCFSSCTVKFVISCVRRQHLFVSASICHSKYKSILYHFRVTDNLYSPNDRDTQQLKNNLSKKETFEKYCDLEI